MSADRKAHNVRVAMDRLRLVQRQAQRLRGQAHRLRSHGLDEVADLFDVHVRDLAKAVDAIDEATAQQLAATEPGMEDTTPFGLPMPGNAR